MVRGAQDLNLPVCISRYLMVIQDSLDMIPPLRIHTDPVNESLCRTAVTDKQDMFLVVSIGPQGTQEQTYAHPLCFHQDNVGNKKCQQHPGGKIFIMLDEPSRSEQHERKNHQANDVGFTDIGKF